MYSNRFQAVRTTVSCLFALAALQPCWGQASLINTWQQRALPGGFEKYRTFPVASNGQLVSFFRTTNGARRVFLTSLADGSSNTVDLQIPTSKSGTLTDVGLTGSGNVVFAVASGSMEMNGTVAVGFHMGGHVGGADVSGNVAFLTDTGNYTPFRVCSSPDGSVWTLGQVVDRETRLSTIQSETTDLLRQYTVGGTLNSSYVARNSLPTGGLYLAPPGSAFGNTVTTAFLSCGDTSVGAYLGFPFNVWIEVDYSTGQAQSWRATSVEKGSLNGLALLGPKKVYASRLMADGNNGLFRLVLTGSGKANWVRYSNADDNVSKLLGRDGASLVHLKDSTVDPANKPVVYWSAPR